MKFEYGGVFQYGDDYLPKLTKPDGTTLIAYELGILVKEIREDNIKDPTEYFHFYVMGDFFDDETKK